jgi:magnesium chelatase family protein
MSFIEVSSFQHQGLEKKEILVQGIKTRGICQLSLSGNLSASLRDSRDKIKAVVAMMAPWGPVDKILLNLLPADLSKFSSQLEVPMALASIALLWPEPLNPDQQSRMKDFTWSGSLSLSGKFDNFEMFHQKTDQKLSSFSSIQEAWAFVLSGEIPLIEEVKTKKYLPPQLMSAEGRDYEKFWLQIAADAQVPVMMIGPPGVGKSHLARWALSCLEKTDSKTREEIDRIWELAGKEEIPIIPLQNPHSRTHLSEFVGVARHEVPRPGILSLAHGGLLILDEFPELARDSREILRNVLDEKKVTKNTKAGFCSWPAKFWLILTANPCPCGYAQGKDLSMCRCQENVRQKYIARFSGPLLDRIGIKFFLTRKSKNILPPMLQERKELQNPEALPLAEQLSPREKKLFTLLWNAYCARTEKNTDSYNFFVEFLEEQRNFTKDWFVHHYG